MYIFDFYIFPDAVLCAKNLRPQEKIVWGVFANQPDLEENSKIIVETAQFLKMHRDTCRKMVKSLIAKGYLIRTKKKTNDGTFGYSYSVPKRYSVEQYQGQKRRIIHPLL